jgi:hypothetical protein
MRADQAFPNLTKREHEILSLMAAGYTNNFVETAGTADHRREVEQHMERMFAAGWMRPEIYRRKHGHSPLS